MVTYYMALGRLTSSFAKGRVPEVKHQDKIYELSIPDFIIWTSLCWNIYNYDELKKVFDERCKENKFLPNFNFDYYLQSLELRGRNIGSWWYTSAPRTTPDTADW